MSSPSIATQQTHYHRCKHPKPYLIITNISKRQNIKNLLQLAVAHGVQTIFIVGQRAFQFTIDNGDGDDTQKTTDIPPAIQSLVKSGKLKIIQFDKLEECVAHIKEIPCCSEMEEDCKSSSSGTSSSTTSIPILGVEIDPTSINLEKEPFTTSTCFMMGNEGSGMTTKQMSVCDGFIRISQYGGGTASLNVSVACGIVLHRFHCWSRKQSISG